MDIDKIDYNVLQNWVLTGKSNALPDDVQLYLDHLEMVRSLYSKYESKAFIINLLCSKTYNYSKYQANKLYADSLNFFYTSNDVKKEAWKNIYAEKLENAALIAWKMQDLETYRKLIISAADLRGVNKQDEFKIPEELYDQRTIIYSIDPKRFNLPVLNRKELSDFIDNLDINDKFKDKVKQDALIEDVDFNLFDEEN